MTNKKRRRGAPSPLILEQHPINYDGYPFITLIQYRDQDLLCIVDNITEKMIKTYVLDYCSQMHVDESMVIEFAAQWYDTCKDRYPLSFEFSKHGLSDSIKDIYKSFTINSVTRVIGPLPKFEMNTIKSIKKRSRKPLSPNIKVQ